MYRPAFHKPYRKARQIGQLRPTERLNGPASRSNLAVTSASSNSPVGQPIDLQAARSGNL